MTVSMALRDHPRVAPETRERIKRIAEEQGYTPDPNLTELMRYLRKRDISKEEPVIAILNPKRAPLNKLCKDSLLIREGVKRRAEELGFSHAWFYDTQMLNADPFVAMAAAAMVTEKIHLGTGVLIPANRIAPVTANALASLNTLAPGRIHLGISTGFTARRAMGLGAVKLDGAVDRKVAAGH